MLEVRPLDALVGASWSKQRFDAWFFGGFATVALVLAATGIYAVVAYAVRQRDREVAIRLAVGASPRAVFAMVVREGMAFPIIGLTAGVGVTLLASGLLRGGVYGVAPTDPRVIGVAALVLTAAGLAACALPARRAMRIAPLEALRTE